MKKLFLMFALVGIIGLSSCSKTNTCTCSGVVVAEYEGLNKSERDAAKLGCELGGCEWN